MHTLSTTDLIKVHTTKKLSYKVIKGMLSLSNVGGLHFTIIKGSNTVEASKEILISRYDCLVFEWVNYNVKTSFINHAIRHDMSMGDYLYIKGLKND